MPEPVEGPLGWEAPERDGRPPSAAPATLLVYERPTYDEVQPWSSHARAALLGATVLCASAAVAGFAIVLKAAGVSSGISAAVIPTSAAAFLWFLRDLEGRVRTFDDAMEIAYVWGGRPMWRKRIAWSTVTACVPITSVASVVAKPDGGVRTTGLFGRGSGVLVSIGTTQRYAIASMAPQQLSMAMDVARAASAAVSRS